MGRVSKQRRSTWPVTVGKVTIGGDNPVVLQSMTSTSTNDVEASVEQTLRIVNAGGEIVRLTAQGQREATAIGEIRNKLRESGCDTPLVADIHFNPKAAYTAAGCCDKVRINPGNFVDPGRTFVKLEYTDEEYAEELARIDRALEPLIDICREHGTALRIGVNHGSLSDRIMSRYGDTPAGMTESAMEFLRSCIKQDFRNIVISIKASNVTVMVETVRRLVAAMDAEDMHFPLHLGVTEAGDGEDGRIKSAVGIGSLLAEGLGDTIRVSLSEDPEFEIPVARMIADYAAEVVSASAMVEGYEAVGYDPIAPKRRQSLKVGIIGGGQPPVVVGTNPEAEYDKDARPDLWLVSLIKENKAVMVESAEPIPDILATVRANPDKAIIINGIGPASSTQTLAVLHAMADARLDNPVITAVDYTGLGLSDEETAIRAAIDLGRLLLDGFADGVMMQSDALDDRQTARTLFTILQSARLRMTRTEYISCPSCGRTLYDLQTTLREIKAATSSLKGLKIGVMGCIVNGPGEMADADYGYVGAGPGRVSLYKGKECVVKNIPTAEAVDRLVALIKENGDWK